ncbi:hypothetical protein BUALT_Bualt05G0082900 [Buddleja alternifolia]|uniref:Ubiquitin carboxyl-terminal hydrolase n=1 Tax=Buddleja alternifolia TaxID=168488 RepID=A0AAV6XQQ0_9LAMI|nr:hypothetical protein BUALT_Bualt05G0082900 [Buddleja alternifolia]
MEIKKYHPSSPEKPSCLPDSSKTLGGNLSLFCDDETPPDAAESPLFLEDESEVKWTDDDDHLLNCFTRRNCLSSYSYSHWAEPWSKSLEFDTNPLDSQCPPPSDDIPSEVPAQESMDNEVNTSLSSCLSQDNNLAGTGAGLANLGNTCFLNAVLQCFIHTVPLLHGILLDIDSLQSNCNRERFCILCSLHDLVKLSLTSSSRVISPWKLVDNLSYFSSSFRRFQQEDAHEFLQCFLDKLESCHDSGGKDKVPLSDNFVKQVFGGRLVSKLKCCNCGHCSDTYEPLIDLSLEIEDADNLLSALQSFTKVERIEDPETKFKCEKCKEQVSIEKQLAFDQVPTVAVFHLKRFKNDGIFIQKIDKHVVFPLEFDLLPFTGSGRANDAELKYILYAIVVHTGLTSTSGHYYCFIRLSPNMWCKFDDSRVVQVEEDFVLSQEAYILFYAKEGTSWFSSFITTQKLCVDSTTLNTSPKSVLYTVDNVSSSTVQKEIICDSNEAIDATGLQHSRVENIETKNSGPRQNTPKSNGSKDNLQRISISVAPFSSDSTDVSSRKSLEEVSPSLLEKVNLRQEEVVGVGNSRNITQTPPRSPSPEIYREDPPDTAFSVPRTHMQLVERISCKRQLEKDVNVDDMETKQAYSFIKKSIPGSRGQQLLAALKGSKSEGCVNKKSRRLGLSRSRDDSSSIIRPALSAGAFR